MPVEMRTARVPVVSSCFDCGGPHGADDDTIQRNGANQVRKVGVEFDWSSFRTFEDEYAAQDLPLSQTGEAVIVGRGSSGKDDARSRTHQKGHASILFSRPWFRNSNTACRCRSWSTAYMIGRCYCLLVVHRIRLSVFLQTAEANNNAGHGSYW